MESFATFAKQKLGEHIKEIEESIVSYLTSDFAPGAYSYHTSTAAIADMFKEYVSRPAKRLRGSFVLESFSMFNRDQMAKDVQLAAVAIELLHAYILIEDDFMDKSDLRRGFPTFHKMVQNYYRDQHLTGDENHGANSFAVLASMLGAHHTNTLLSRLKFSPEILIRALRTVNETVNVTVYGQIRDIFNQLVPIIVEHDILEVHRLKTSYYTYFNPIQLGAILANQPDSTIEIFKEYTEPAGIAFQIQDDILGVFGDSKDTGKSVMDDLKEGKATLLTVYAKEHATPVQKDILTRAIGNTNLEQEPELFEQAKQVFIDTGSLDHSKQVAQELVQKAKKSMYKNFDEYKETDGFKFIVGIADYMIERKL